MGRWGDGEMGETRRINPDLLVISHQSSVNTAQFSYQIPLCESEDCTN
ncbi:hypothetical protein [Nostoc linckia]|nr:hypothetical protein [Nostoc linckia]